MKSVFFDIIHEVGQYLLVPCTIILILFIFISILQVGSIIVEYFMERRKFKENVPKLLEQIHLGGVKDICSLIDNSFLLNRQKKAIHDLFNAKDMQKASLTVLAQTILTKEDDHYEKNTLVTDLIIKLGPMFGLLGTLIPLGPGIVALGQGNTALLSESMGIAFDTTIIGIATAAVCYVVSNMRKRWYQDYMNSLESIMECVLEEVTKHA